MSLQRQNLPTLIVPWPQFDNPLLRLSSELWNGKRVKETDPEITGIRRQLEEMSNSKIQLDSEVSLLMAQLQEKEADECVTQVSCS